jgi:uncharacterized membrane protein
VEQIIMRRLLQVVSWVALAGTIVPSALYLAGRIELDESKSILLVATIAWFIATPLWMGKKKADAA